MVAAFILQGYGSITGTKNGAQTGTEPQKQPRKQTGNKRQQGGRIYDKLIVSGKTIAAQEEKAAAFTTD